SAAKSQPLDQGAVARDVLLGQVVEEPAPLPDEEQEATAAVVIVLVHLEVLGQVGDAPRQQRDLNLRGACVALGLAVIADDGLLCCSVERHGATQSPSEVSCAALRGMSTRALSSPRPRYGSGKGTSARA